MRISAIHDLDILAVPMKCCVLRERNDRKSLFSDSSVSFCRGQALSYILMGNDGCPSIVECFIAACMIAVKVGVEDEYDW